MLTRYARKHFMNVFIYFLFDIISKQKKKIYRYFSKTYSACFFKFLNKAFTLRNMGLNKM